MRNPSGQHGCRLTECVLNGVRVLYMENALLRVGVNIDKGAEIFEFRHKPTDVDAMWRRDYDPPTRSIVCETAPNGLDAFFDRFGGGWQESFPAGNSFGDFQGGEQYLHGEVSLLPWEYAVVDSSPSELAVSYSVSCRRTPFSLVRVMSLKADTAAVRFEETIVNHGRIAIPYAWGHHPAFGPPLLAEGSRFDLPSGIYHSWPPEADDLPRMLSAGEVSQSPVLPGKSGGEVDLTRAFSRQEGTMDNFFVKLSGPGIAAIRNPVLELGVGITWDDSVMPYLWKWDVCHAPIGYPLWGRDYLSALEPFNCPIGGICDLSDDLPRLEPGCRQEFELQAGFCPGGVPFEGEFLSVAL